MQQAKIKTIIIIILCGLSLTLATIQDQSPRTPKQESIQSTVNNLQKSDYTQKAMPQGKIVDKGKKDPSENQQPSPSEAQKNITQEIIDKIQSKEKYIIVSNQYAQTMNSFLETHDYKKVATTPDGNLYEYQRAFGHW